MRILMLGWEFPPFISGGLGTACFGLTRALDRMGHEVIFVLPRPVGHDVRTHVRLLAPDRAPSAALAPLTGAPTGRWVHHAEPGGAGPLAADAPLESPEDEPAPGNGYNIAAIPHARFYAVPSGFSSPYGSGEPVGLTPELQAALAAMPPSRRRAEIEALIASGVSIPPGAEWDEWLADGHDHDHHPAPQPSHSGARPGDYSGDLFAEAARYARLVVRLARHEKFDVVHAHDWLTFPAGMSVARATGRPLVVHIHATEFDRSGEHVNQRVYDIERRGMHAAIRVVCVSEYTRRICEKRYGLDPAKSRVVYNGVELESVQPETGVGIEAKDKIVLFLGRITMQKGPEYFIQAAKRVLEKMDNVKFVVAGSGDMATRMIEYAASLGIGHKVLFTGFLRGRDVQRIFEMADLYVMPSVSEPFGIAPLEAMSHGTPVIISKQSGVSEVLTHALKVDFWDIDDMANKVIAVLRHPPLGATLREHGALEVRRLTWDGAATKVTQVYEDAVSVLRSV